VLLPLIGWWTYGLFDLDEGFYGAVTAEMARRGEWITPYFNGSPWFEKPILLYWLARPCMQLFGDMIGPRMPSVICSLLLAWTIFKLSRPVIGLSGALASVLVCATSLLMVALGRMMMTDMPLIVAFTAAMLLLYRSTTDRPQWRWAVGACVGLAVLAKGPVAILLTVGVLIWTYWRQPELRNGLNGGWHWAILACLAVISTWYVPCYLANGEVFVQKFLVEQNLRRFQGGDTAHAVPWPMSWLFYPLILLLGMAPWSGKFWQARPWTLAPSDSRNFLRFCSGWAFVVFAFFLIGSAKLVHYIAPAVPPLAICLGSFIASRHFRDEDGIMQDPAPTWSFLQPFAITAFCQFVIANAGFLAYYYGAFGNDSHAEIHALAKMCRGKGAEVAVYKLSRQSADQGTGKLQLQQTSHPSVVMVVNQNVLDLNELSQLESAQTPLWVITRTGRISINDENRLGERGRFLRRVPTAPMQHYELYRLESAN
jgi:4-amino-4-deoxy-L-arabinose transferase-like glycosyltransferase